MANCNGVITRAKFEKPAEALYSGKKLLVVPIKEQYEQYCNAEALKLLGVKVIENFDIDCIKEIYQWYYSAETLRIDFKDQSTIIVQTLLSLSSLASLSQNNSMKVQSNVS